MYSVNNKHSKLPNKLLVYKRDGLRLNLSRFKGKPILIGYWSFICMSCIKKSLPSLNKLANDIGGYVNIVLINIDHVFFLNTDLKQKENLFYQYAPDLTFYAIGRKQSMILILLGKKRKTMETFRKIFAPIILPKDYNMEIHLPMYQIFNKKGREIARIIKCYSDYPLGMDWYKPDIKKKLLKEAGITEY